MQETDKEVTEDNFKDAVEILLEQNAGLFMNQIESLSSYQMNFIRAICDGHHSDFTSRALSEEYNLGAKSNITRIKTALADKELVETKNSKSYIIDPVFEMWFRKVYL